MSTCIGSRAIALGDSLLITESCGSSARLGAQLRLTARCSMEWLPLLRFGQSSKSGELYKNEVPFQIASRRCSFSRIGSGFACVGNVTLRATIATILAIFTHRYFRAAGIAAHLRFFADRWQNKRMFGSSRRSIFVYVRGTHCQPSCIFSTFTTR